MVTENWFLDFNLKMLNLWIGLCKGDDQLPKDIRALGYKQHAIEQNIRVIGAKKLLCVPELIIFSGKLGHSLICEWKSGKNLEEDQAARYLELTPDILSNRALIPKEATGSFDVMYICDRDNVERIKIGFNKCQCKFPLIVADDRGLNLELNQFKLGKLNEIFSPSLLINMSLCPTCHVPISDTSADWEVADIVIPKLIERMLKRDTMVGISSLCPSVFPLWDNMTSTARAPAQARVCQILEQAAAGEFGTFFRYRSKNAECQIDINFNPVDVHGSARRGGLLRLQNAAKTFKERLVRGQKYVYDPYLPFPN
jgi:hypothetical protein